MEEAESFSEKGVVFIQGDLNARTGTEPDYIEHDKSDDIFNIQNLEKPLSRNSDDKKLCERGTKLLDLCKYMDFLIVNGRKTEDIFGKYTSIQWNGSSVVDYVITPASSFDRIMKFQVGKYYPWFSDHCPLFYLISLSVDIAIERHRTLELKDAPKKRKWDSRLKAAFSNNLESEAIKSDFFFFKL